MGFPAWTLVGMGLSALAGLVLLILAYLAQSPRLLKRLGLAGYRLDLRARLFTGYALASMLLALGFFLAGVPLGVAPPPAETVVVEITATPTVTIVDISGTEESPSGAAMAADSSEPAGATAAPINTPASDDTASQPTRDSDSGAFGGQVVTPAGADSATTGEAEPALTATPTPAAAATAVEEDGTLRATATPATPTVVPSPTATATPTPTLTPTPTVSPTPIVGETAIIGTGSSTIWLKRTPGGQDLVLVKGGDIVILMPGHANLAGQLWREISTVDGTVGWLEENFLSFPEATSS